MSKRIKVTRPAAPVREIDRRLRKRYAIEREVLYRVLHNQQCTRAGCGKTLNASSRGIWFTTESPLEPGQSVELAVNWPATLADKHPLVLMVYGTVIRAQENDAALAIRRYEFRTEFRANNQDPADLSREPLGTSELN